MPARTNITAVTDGGQRPLPPLPRLPEKLKKIVPEMEQYERQMDEWLKKTNVAIFGVNGE